jgi:hypothetical protein
MAGETLLTTTELLSGFPDNASGLIEAVDSRNFVVSAVNGVGFYDDNNDPTGPWTVPNAGAGVPVDILSNLPIPTGDPNAVFVGNYYRLDGNNHFVPSYVDEGITVPPGTIRIVDGSVGFVIAKPGGGTETGTIRGTKAGVPYLPGRQVSLTSTPIAFVSTGARLVDVSLAEPISVEWIPDAATDLIVSEFRINLRMVLV